MGVHPGTQVRNGLYRATEGLTMFLEKRLRRHQTFSRDVLAGTPFAHANDLPSLRDHPDARIYALRLDRGMMGDGVIDIPKIRQLVEATGYKGYREVEIFSSRNWWQRDPDEVIEIVKERYLKYV